MRVIIYSYIHLFAESLSYCIKSNSDKIDVSFCEQSDNLARDVIDLSPDIALIDITTENSLTDARLAYERCKKTAFVAMAVPEIPKEVIACADAGFVAYVPRNASIDNLIQIMNKALEGECLSSPKIVGSLLQEVRRRHEQHEEKITTNKALTQRECEVLSLLERGTSNKIIARQLNVSVSTVKNHLHNAFTKLHVSGRTEALARIKNEPWLLQKGSDSHSRQVASLTYC